MAIKVLLNIFALLLVAYTAAGNSVSTDETVCPQICPALYAPVCATDGHIFKEFSNTCELQGSNCRRQRDNANVQPFIATEMDWCTSEFVDDILLTLGNLNVQTPECLKPCPMIYAPVCVSNGKYRTLLANQCQMDTFNCVLTTAGFTDMLKVLREGSCSL